MERCSNVKAAKEVARYSCNLWKGPAFVKSTVDFIACFATYMYVIVCLGNVLEM
jgi:hypothetical protein